MWERFGEYFDRYGEHIVEYGWMDPISSMPVLLPSGPSDRSTERLTESDVRVCRWWFDEDEPVW